MSIDEGNSILGLGPHFDAQEATMSDENKSVSDQTLEVLGLSQSDLRASVDAPQDRFAYLDEQAKKAQAEAEATALAYKDVTEGQSQDAAKTAEAIKASAAEDRTQPRLDPMELIRQLERMRKDGFDEATIRAAFNEVMDEQSGNFRRPMRRVVRSEGMAKMLSQEEMNRHYTKQVYSQKDGESDSAMDERIALILERMEQTKHMKLEIQKPTLKMRAYRVAYFLLKGPVSLMIRILTIFSRGR